ncbi:response regulator [candidate division KSB3 bacterium]|uniref:histidine kinase n=1 Tax=candidate division KSB3 bacterium TaxID=2044937 RepID=A0A9D5JYC8_9BACT|nr:response regulator [candidate division KSB3 bacterium]MBD3326433.1 response regulator [candidate division KSB3 bacterium]
MSDEHKIIRVDDDDDLIFADETLDEEAEEEAHPWKLLIVDDEEGVHHTTQRVLDDLVFQGQGLTYVNASSGAEAMQLIRDHPDTAIILLDVVMETDTIGLDVVRYIREELGNSFVRILLRTGQPGQAPERKVITEYDINDYKLKATLTEHELYTAVISALRSYTALQTQEHTRQALQHALEDAQIAHKARYQFLVNMGHELRTPLNGIIGFTEVLLENAQTAEQQDYLTTIKRSGADLLKVLNAILELTDLMGGECVLQASLFSLRDILAEIMHIIDIQAQWKHLQTSCQIDPDVPDTLLTDPQRLKQVLINILANALKHTESGHIALHVSRVSADSHQLLFTVRDTGIGIAKDKHDQIFQPFVLGEDVFTKRFGGIGLGLAIAKDLIEKMGGTIWLDSEPGQGSTFYFTITYQQA